LADFQTLGLKRAGARDSIAVVTLNRPESANAVTHTLALELNQALDKVLQDSAVKAIVLTGAGKHFCGGMDARQVGEIADQVKAGTATKEPYNGVLQLVQKATLAIYGAAKPVIAAVNGSAAAGGMDVALACDYRIVSSTAKFVSSYVKLGLPALDGGAWLLARLLRPGAAFRVLLSGETLDAQQALALGIADEVVAPDALLAHSVALAERVSIGSVELTGLLKHELRSQSSLEDALRRAYLAGIEFMQKDQYLEAARQLAAKAS
jgi:2-(1,2-epoxy-1,2-dihydrophenyl)acetyl-CoA isomerase